MYIEKHETWACFSIYIGQEVPSFPYLKCDRLRKAPFTYKNQELLALPNYISITSVYCNFVYKKEEEDIILF